MSTHSSMTYKKVDGPAPAQASITITSAVEPIPSHPRHGKNGHYPRGGGGTSAGSVIKRGDLLFTKVSNQRVLTNHGVTQNGCIASMGYQAKPEENKEDEFCAKWNFVGLAKNSMTNPEDGNFSNTGVFRASSHMEAVQVAGSTSIDYNGVELIHAGQPVIWHPPLDLEYSKTNDRPVPIVGPLNWTKEIANPIHQINTMMLEIQSMGVGNGELLDLDVSASENDNTFNSDYYNDYDGDKNSTWEDAALQRKRSVLCQSMATILVLARRGYLEILDLQNSWKRACKDKFINSCLNGITKIAAGGGNDKQLFGGLIEAVEQYNKDMSSGWEDSENVNTSAFNMEESSWCVDAQTNTCKLYNLNRLKFINQMVEPHQKVMNKNQEDTVGHLIQTDISLAWLVRSLGLGLRPEQDEHRHTVLDVLRLSCRSSMRNSDTNQFLTSVGDLFGGGDGMVGDDITKTFRALRVHLDNHDFGYWNNILKVQERTYRRVIGHAISSVNVLGQHVTSNEKPYLDIIIGPQLL